MLLLLLCWADKLLFFCTGVLCLIVPAWSLAKGKMLESELVGEGDGGRFSG